MRKPLFGDVPRTNKIIHEKHVSVGSVSSSKSKVHWHLILTRLNAFIFFRISLLCTHWKIVNKTFTVSNQFELTKVFKILDSFKLLEKSEIKPGTLVSFLTGGSEKIPTFGVERADVFRPSALAPTA